jgi:hypothetical protein
VAIKKGTNILWSYLIWYTADKPEDKALGGNCYFQWGRKDPLQYGCTIVNNQDEDGVSYSIMNPTSFIRGGGTGSVWYTNSISNSPFYSELWGESGSKTVWDPCPQGYRVPSKGDYSGLAESVVSSKFEPLGYIGSTGSYSYQYDYFYWTRTTGFSSDVRILSWALESLAKTGNDLITTEYREMAMPIRCVKD